MSESKDGDDVVEVEERDTTVSHEHDSDDDNDDEEVTIGIGDNNAYNPPEEESEADEEDLETGFDESQDEGEGESEEESTEEDEARYDTDDPKSVIEYVIEEYDGLIMDDDTVQSDFAQAVADADDEIIDENWEEIKDRLFCGVTLRELRRISDQVDLDFNFYNVEPPACNVDGCLSRIEFDDKGRLTTHPLLNFELRMEEKIRLPGEDGVTAEFVLDRQGKANITIEADPAVTGDKRDFKKEITSSYFDTVFEQEGKDAMRDINKFLGSIDLPIKEGVEKIGVQDGNFVLPGEVVDHTGWVTDSNYTIIPIDEETNIHEKFNGGRSVDDDEMREMIRLLTNIRGAERLTPVLSWFMASCHASEIRKHFDIFNHLNITGTSGCGKTRTAELLTELAGWNYDGGCEIEDTSYSIDNKLHSINDGFVWFDEYYPSEVKDYDLKKFHRKFKGAATGATSSRGNWDGSEDSWEIECPLLVTGEAAMQKNALDRRSINVRFGDVTNNDEYAVPFKKLKGKGQFSGMFDKQAFAEEFYRFAVETRNEGIKQDFQRCIAEVEEIVSDWDIQLNNDEQTGLALILWGWELLHEFADRFNVDESELPTEQEMRASLRHCAGVNDEGQGGGRVTEEDEFMRLFSRAAAADDYLEHNTDYTVVKGDSVDCELRIKTERVFDKLSRYVRDHDSSTELLDSGREYKSRFSQLAGESDTYIDDVSVNSPPVNRCTAVKVRDVVDSVPGFSAACIDGVEFNFIDYLDDDGDSVDSEVSHDKGGMQVFVKQFFGNRGSHHVKKSNLVTEAHENEGFGMTVAQNLIDELINDDVLVEDENSNLSLIEGVSR